MGEGTRISWATHTFNGWWGCQKVSPACDLCYAEMWSNRMGFDVWGQRAPRRFFGETHWNEPLRWDRRAAAAGRRDRVFAYSMADLFEDRRDLDPWREKQWALIEATPNLDWMLLSKRADCIGRMLPKAWLKNPRPNVWLGVTAENQRRAEERIPELLNVPAVVHWISAEPLLGPIDFSPWFQGAQVPVTDDLEDAPDGAVVDGMERSDSAWHRTTGLDWIIVGGESGAGARRMDPAWARDILAQCRRANVAYHMKQKGGVLAKELGCKDKEGKDPDEWPAELRVQEFPKGRLAS